MLSTQVAFSENDWDRMSSRQTEVDADALMLNRPNRQRYKAYKTVTNYCYYSYLQLPDTGPRLLARMSLAKCNVYSQLTVAFTNVEAKQKLSRLFTHPEHPSNTTSPVELMTT